MSMSDFEARMIIRSLAAYDKSIAKLAGDYIALEEKMLDEMGKLRKEVDALHSHLYSLMEKVKQA